MKFEHFSGTDFCYNVESIAQVMKKQNDKGFNEFWISTETPFPFMAVLTNQSFAYVHFFDEEDSPGFSALSDADPEFDTDQVPVFYTNNCSEIIEVEAGCVLNIDKAIKIVQEFFNTRQMPDCIQWDEM